MSLSRPAQATRAHSRRPRTHGTDARRKAMRVSALAVRLPDGTVRRLSDTTPDEVFSAILLVTRRDASLTATDVRRHLGFAKERPRSALGR
jgi:hypothetical protein